MKNTADNYCLARSLVLAKARADYQVENNGQSFAVHERLKTDQRYLTELAVQLMQDSGVALDQGDYGLEDLRKMAEHLRNYEIRLYHRNHGRRLYAIAEGGLFNKGAGDGLITIAFRDGHFEPFRVCLRILYDSKKKRERAIREKVGQAYINCFSLLETRSVN